MSNLSVLSLLSNADVVVQLVMLILLIASVFSWTIIFNKMLSLKRQLKQASMCSEWFKSAKNISDIEEGSVDDSAFSNVLFKGVHEFQGGGDLKGVQREVLEARVKVLMDSECDAIVNEFERNVDWLATVGSTAPFVGLFGTVWGIMNSFQSIGVAKSATLAIVAPNIAEALLATAAGLAVAIPAVIFYNRIVVNIEDFSKLLRSFSSRVQVALFNGL